MVEQELNRNAPYPMRPSAKVIAFPVRGRWEPGRPTPGFAPRIQRGRLPKLTPWLLLLAPLIVIGSLVSFLAVVGVFLVWLIIVIVLVFGVVLFARRLFRRSVTRPINGLRPRATG